MVTFLYSRLSRESVNDSSDSCSLLFSTDVADSEHAIKEVARPRERKSVSSFYLFRQRTLLNAECSVYESVFKLSFMNENTAIPWKNSFRAVDVQNSADPSKMIFFVMELHVPDGVMLRPYSLESSCTSRNWCCIQFQECPMELSKKFD